MAKNENLIYGIARLKFKGEMVGWVEKGSFNWSGKKPESTDVEAEQVPDVPVGVLQTKNGTIQPTFNLIQLDYKNLKLALGGTLVGLEGAYTGWKAPTELIALSGPWQIDFMSGKRCDIPNGALLSNLGGKLTLTEVSKVECEIKVIKPEDGGSPYEINDIPADEQG